MYLSICGHVNVSVDMDIDVNVLVDVDVGVDVNTCMCITCQIVNFSICKYVDMSCVDLSIKLSIC